MIVQAEFANIKASVSVRRADLEWSVVTETNEIDEA